MIFYENAPAKLNLTLDVHHKRPDGYHNLCMVTQSLRLCDRVVVAPTRDKRFRAYCPGTALPQDERNLAARAARVFCEATGVWPGGADILLRKHIPAGAGLGGGSADAAAVLRALRTGLAPDLSDAAISALGAQIGSDVPYCLQNGTKLVSGRGEIVTELPPFPALPVVLCKPAISLSTATVFSRLQPDLPRRRPDTEGFIGALRSLNAIKDGDDPKALVQTIARLVCNTLEDMVVKSYPEIGGIRQALLSHGALGAAMTGTGSAVFGLFADTRTAAGAYLFLRRRHTDTFLTRISVSN